MLATHKNHMAYCTMQYTLYVSQIRPYIENEESFRELCHGGPSHDSILRRTSVTDFWFFEKKYFHSKISYVFRWTSWINNTGAQSKSSKILEVQVYSSTAFCLKVLHAIFNAYCRQSLYALRRRIHTYFLTAGCNLYPRIYSCTKFSIL